MSLKVLAGWEPLSGAEWFFFLLPFLIFGLIVFPLALYGVSLLYRLAKWIEGSPSTRNEDTNP